MKETILVLDDDVFILDEIVETLSNEGFHVITAQTGEELWKISNSSQIDLFILDLKLNGESGLDIVRQLRSTSEVGIIIVSGKRGETDRVLGLELGADDYVTKPFGPLELLARVRSVLRRTKGNLYPGPIQKPAEQSVAEFCGFKLDFNACHLRDLNGEPIPLTSAEFKLLKAFVENPNQVLNREYLLDYIHGRKWIGYDRSIDGLVSRLRRKIPPPLAGNPPMVKTMHGAGYMFVGDVRYVPAR